MVAANRTDSLIKATGGDYSTLQAWEDDIGVGLGSSTDLVADGYSHYGWLASEEFDENWTIGGHTSDATHHIFLAADSNGATVSASQHGQTKVDAALMDDDTRALVYNTSYASILSNDGYTTGLDITDSFVDISRLQFRAVSGTPKDGVRSFSGDNTAYRRCLFEFYQVDSFTRIGMDLAKTDTVHACLVIGTGTDEHRLWDTNDDIVNCTFVIASGATAYGTGLVLHVDYGEPDIENCALFSGGAGSKAIQHQSSTAWEVLDYNVTDHSDLSEDSGEGANNTYSKVDTDQFVAVNNTDWSLKSGNDFTNGTDKTAVVPNDIWGNAFGTTDQGCEAQSVVSDLSAQGIIISEAA